MNSEKLERLRVTRAIKRALARIAKQDPELAQLLRETIKTGTFLSYSPQEVQPVSQLKRASEREKSTPHSRNDPNAH